MKFRIQICFFISCVTPFVTTFSWKTCGTTLKTIEISNLDVLSNSNTWYLTGRGSVKTNITSPVKGIVDMQKRFFWGWTKIPCVNEVGSCNYTDICQLSPYINRPCPSQFIADDLPCRCPILEGNYTLNKFPINLSLLPHWVEGGKYRIKLSLFHNAMELICLLIYIVL